MKSSSLNTPTVDGENIVSFMKDNNGDFVIQLGDREQIVHSKVLKKCAFFTAAVESGQCKIKLDTEKVTEYECQLLLEYLKDTEHFKGGIFNPACGSLLIPHCLLLWYISDYFSLPELKSQAVREVTSECAGILRNADWSIGSGALVAELRISAEYCYAGKGRDAGPCKDAMLDLCYQMAHGLYYLEKFQDLLQEVPEFASDLAWTILDHRAIEPRPTTCVTCRRFRRFCKRTEAQLAKIEEQVQATTRESTLGRLYKEYYQMHMDIRDVLFPKYRPEPHRH